MARLAILFALFEAKEKSEITERYFYGTLSIYVTDSNIKESIFLGALDETSKRFLISGDLVKKMSLNFVTK